MELVEHRGAPRQEGDGEVHADEARREPAQLHVTDQVLLGRVHVPDHRLVDARLVGDVREHEQRRVTGAHRDVHGGRPDRRDLRLGSVYASHVVNVTEPLRVRTATGEHPPEVAMRRWTA